MFNNKQTLQPSKSATRFVFEKSNYILMLLGIAMVIMGFFIMSGNTEIYSFEKIVIAPLTVLSGYAVGFFSIFKRSKKPQDPKNL